MPSPKLQFIRRDVPHIDVETYEVVGEGDVLFGTIKWLSTRQGYYFFPSFRVMAAMDADHLLEIAAKINRMTTAKIQKEITARYERP